MIHNTYHHFNPNSVDAEMFPGRMTHLKYSRLWEIQRRVNQLLSSFITPIPHGFVPSTLSSPKRPNSTQPQPGIWITLWRAKWELNQSNRLPISIQVRLLSLFLTAPCSYTRFDLLFRLYQSPSSWEFALKHKRAPNPTFPTPTVSTNSLIPPLFFLQLVYSMWGSYECLHRAVNVTRDAFLLAARDPAKLAFSADPLPAMIVFVATLMVLCFVVSTLMRNYSQVDRLWSLLPPFIIGFYWYRTPFVDARLTLMFVLSLAWGLRLTYNFWRKGGYNPSDEDYRWAILIKKIDNTPLWVLFNITFICFFQLMLLFLIASPAEAAYRQAGIAPLTSVDMLLLVAFVTLLSIETIADQQQWVFQNEKYRLRAEREPLEGDYRLGFLTHGLFAYSRHPNFCAEISMWWVMYLFGVNATGNWLHWSLAGPVLLTLLFQGSTNFTEGLTAEKYKDYVKYQQTTSRLLPWFPSNEPIVSTTRSSNRATPSRARQVIQEATTEAILHSPKHTAAKAPSTAVSSSAPAAGSLSSPTKSRAKPAPRSPRASRTAGDADSAAPVAASPRSPRSRRTASPDPVASHDDIAHAGRTRGQKAAIASLSPKGRSSRSRI